MIFSRIANGKFGLCPERWTYGSGKADKGKHVFSSMQGQYLSVGLVVAHSSVSQLYSSDGPSMTHIYGHSIAYPE